MDITSIILIVAAFVIGAIIAFFFANKRTVQGGDIVFSDAASSLAETIQKNESELADWQAKYDQQRNKYEAAIADAKQKYTVLEQQLNQAINGNIDEAVKEQLASVEKLKKKIKDLEDDLDDATDDADSFKKKLKQKTEDYNTLQDEFASEKKEAEQLRADLEEKEQKLTKKEEELKLKVASLDFIQEILSANEVSNADVRKMQGKIADVDNFVNDALMDACKVITDHYPDNIKLTDAYGQSLQNCNNAFAEYKKSWQQRFEEWKAIKSKSWLHGKTTIAFVGEFSAGKTSIVNRLLSQDNPNVPLLPVSTKATTAIPTYIAGGKATSYQFVTPDDKLKVISESTFKKVDKSILDQVKGVSALIQYFVMTYKNPNLEGMSILDTPGFSSNDSEDRERTLEVINECDALFWAFDVNAGTVNRSSISLIKENLKKPLYVVINKVDTKSDSEVTKVEQLIKNTLSENGVKVEMFIRFSQKAPLSVMMDAIKSVKQTKEKETFFDDLTAELTAFSTVADFACKEYNKQYQELDKQYEDAVDSFNTSLYALRENCETAKDIPHWEEHFFSSDRYEMDAEEGESLIGLLENISSENCDNLTASYNNTGEIVQMWQEAYQNYSEAKNVSSRVDDIKKRLNKICGNINQKS